MGKQAIQAFKKEVTNVNSKSGFTQSMKIALRGGLFSIFTKSKKIALELQHGGNPRKYLAKKTRVGETFPL